MAAKSSDIVDIVPLDEVFQLLNDGFFDENSNIDDAIVNFEQEVRIMFNKQTINYWICLIFEEKMHMLALSSCFLSLIKGCASYLLICKHHFFNARHLG